MGKHLVSIIIDAGTVERFELEDCDKVCIFFEHGNPYYQKIPYQELVMPTIVMVNKDNKD